MDMHHNSSGMSSLSPVLILCAYMSCNNTIAHVNLGVLYFLKNLILNPHRVIVDCMRFLLTVNSLPYMV